jgi:hypothetical protein
MLRLGRPHCQSCLREECQKGKTLDVHIWVSIILLYVHIQNHTASILNMQHMDELILIQILMTEKYLHVTGLGILSTVYAMMSLKTTWKLKRFIT